MKGKIRKQIIKIPMSMNYRSLIGSILFISYRIRLLLLIPNKFLEKKKRKLKLVPRNSRES